MGQVGVAVTKSLAFRGVAQEFSNVYHYEFEGSATAALADGLIDAILNIERNIHHTSVSFVYARGWTSGGTKAENNMLTQRNLTGNGNNVYTPLDGQDPERAFLVRIRAGDDSRGRPVYLRKWWHLHAGRVENEPITSAVLANQAQLSQALRTILENKLDVLKQIQPLGGAGPTANLVSERGRNTDGPTQAHPYLEHHQLGDMWRG